MRYELKYDDFSTECVSPAPGDILVLVYEDGSKRIFHAYIAHDTNACSECHLSGSSYHSCGVYCTHWNFTCIDDLLYTSIDTLLEDL